jgi:hypothetical protein
MLELIKFLDARFVVGIAPRKANQHNQAQNNWDVDLRGSTHVFSDMVSKSWNIHEKEVDEVSRQFSQAVESLLVEHLQKIYELERAK